MGKAKGILDHTLILEIKDDADLEAKRLLYSVNQKIQFNCTVCGKHVESKFNQKQECLCFNCQRKQTSLERFGVDNYAKSPEYLRRQEETNLHLYGTKHYNQSQSYKNRQAEITEKRKRTCEQRFGKPVTFQADVVKLKAKESLKNRFGDLDNFYKQRALKAAQTLEAHFGDKHYGQFGSESFKTKMLKKYGNEHYCNLEKAKITCKQRYGFENWMSSEEARKLFSKNYHKHPHAHYRFNNTSFDSSWELALWIYAKDHNECIERESCYFEYEFENQTYRYYPDFRYKGELIEIKSDFLYKFMLIKNTRDFAKLCLIKQKDVKVWLFDKLKPILEYVNNTYGRRYLKSFKI